MYCPNCGQENPDQARFCRHCGSRMPETPTETTTDAELELIEGSSEFVGMTLGRYRVLKQVRLTTTGVIYRALDTQLDRIVEIKVLPRDYAEDEYRRRTFREEISLAAGLEHANILPVHDFGRVGDNFFVVTKHADGHSLARHIEKRAPLAPVEMLRIGIQIASALVYLHRHFIIHGRLSAASFILDESGHVMLRDVDFYTSRQWRDPGVPLTSEEQSERREMARLKRVTDYQAPEIAGGGQPDARSDIYSLGVILYHLLTGHLPFDEGEGEADELTFRGVPLALEELLISMLRRDPLERLETADEVREALRRAYSVSITSLAGDQEVAEEFIDFSRLNTAQDEDRHRNVEALLVSLSRDVDLRKLARRPGDEEALEAIAAGDPAPPHSISHLSFFSVLDDCLAAARRGSVADALSILDAGVHPAEAEALAETHRYLNRLAERERNLKRARFILGNNLVTEFRRAAESFRHALEEDPSCIEAREGLELLGDVGELWQPREQPRRRRWLKPLLFGGGGLFLLVVLLIIFINPSPGELADNLTPRGLLPGGHQPPVAGATTAVEALELPAEPAAAPAFAGDYVLVSLEGEALAAFSLLTGDEVWRTAGVAGDHPPLVYRGEPREEYRGVLISAGGGRVELRDHEGRLLVQRELESRLAAVPALGAEGQLYVANDLGTVFAFDLSTPGRLLRLWATNLGSLPAGLFPAPSGKRLLVTFTDGQLALYDGYNGAELWTSTRRLPLGGPLTVDYPRPVFDDETIHLTVGDRYLAFDRTTGAVVEELQLSAGTLGNACLHEGSVFFASGGGTVFRLVPGTEPTVYSEELEVELTLERPLICGTELFFRRADGQLQAVNTSTLGPVPRELPVADYPLAVSRGNAYLVDGRTVYRLSAQPEDR
ncbi:MAG: PQQ-binding-like beta-propeller repeat protein [Candidatus Coatesbacteria bacterium]|nr:PQQ-binding-like beta-propeller repeat protein [Candidatus Coatesbacteria bacterium]